MDRVRVYRGHRYRTAEAKILLDDMTQRQSWRAVDNPKPRPDHAVRWSHIHRARKYLRKTRAARERGDDQQAAIFLKSYGYYEGLADEFMSDELGRNLRVWWAVTPLSA